MKKWVIIFLYVFFSYKLLAFEYFDNSIDYWNLTKSVKKESHPMNKKAQTKNNSQDPLNIQDNTKFNWAPYLNPKTTDDLREIFREGDHTPPMPLLEVAKNPTDENIKNWFELVKRKNQFLTRLNQKMSDYLRRKNNLKPSERKFIQSRQEKMLASTRLKKSIDYKRFRFRMYFESSCPHCKRMMDELVKLQDMGFYVELRQIDDNKRHAKGLPFVVSQASKAEIKEKKIDSWPVLFIGDQKNKVVYRINGFQTSKDILFTLQNK